MCTVLTIHVITRSLAPREFRPKLSFLYCGFEIGGVDRWWNLPQAVSIIVFLSWFWVSPKIPDTKGEFFPSFTYICIWIINRDGPRVSSTRVKPGFSTKLETRVIKIKTRVPEKFQILLFFTIFSYILSYLSFLLIAFLFSPTFFSYF